MQVPMKNPSVRMDAMPGVSAGPMATADNFGASKYRGLGELAGAVGKLGLSVLDEAQARQKKEDDSLSAYAINQMHIRYRDGIQAIYDECKGEKAVEAPAKVAKFMQTIQLDLDRGLQNNMQRETFSRAFQNYSAQTQEKAFMYRDGEMDAFRTTQYQAQNKLIEDDADEALVGANGIKDVLDGYYLEGIVANTDKLTEGQPPEARELARRQVTQAFHQQRLQTLATVNPEKAVEYLRDTRVRDAFPTAAYATLSEAYGKAAEEAKKSEQAKQRDLGAIQDARGSKTENEIREEYLNDPGLTAESAKAKFETFKAARTSENNNTIATKTARVEQLRDEYAEAKFNIAAMPDSLRLTERERAELVKWGNGFRENGGKDAPPDIAYLLKLDGMNQAGIQEILLDEEKAREFYEKTGGHKSEYAKQYIAKALGRNDDKRALIDTNMGWVADKFALDQGLVIASERDAEAIDTFAKRFDALAKVRARELKLNKADDLPVGEREKIYAKLMTTVTNNHSPTLSQIPLLGRWFQPDEKPYHEVLADPEADIEAYAFPKGDEESLPDFVSDVPEAISQANESSNASPAKPAGGEDDGGVDDSADAFRPDYARWYGGLARQGQRMRQERAARTGGGKPEVPAAVKRVIGNKGNMEEEVVTDDDGNIRYVKVTETTKSGKRVVYYDPDGNVIPKDQINA